MRKGYYHGEKSVGLAPIVLVLAAVTAVSFGTVYCMFSHQVASVNSEDDSSASVQQTSTVAAPAKPRAHGNV
ncbi:MAG TPA: hypothetical protein V6C81_16630 [Planktothrix sp.]|jgi:hypothetical protein